jgi:hypothetical protein
MSIITYPGYRIASFRWNKANQAIVNRSPFGSQSVDAASPLWEASMTGVSESRSMASQISQFLESFEGYRNQVALWNFLQPAPLGTMRGTMTLSADAAQGATSLSITAGAGQAGKTLLKGDLIGFGSGLTQQVVRLTADATADGTGLIAVSIGTPLRNAFLAGAAVTWDKPKALFRQKTLNEGIDVSADGAQPWTLSLIEDVRP